MLEQFAKAGLEVRYIIEHLANDASPALDLSLLTSAQVCTPIQLFLAGKRTAKASLNVGYGVVAAEAPAHLRVDLGGAGRGVDERSNCIEGNRIDIRQAHRLPSAVH